MPTATWATTSFGWFLRLGHPVLSSDARIALTLRLLGGLTTDEIARAFLVPEPTVAQRIVRAKRTLTEARVPFEVPRADALAVRLASVLQVIYLIFNEGYSATAGDNWMRPALCEEALRLGRILAELTPKEPEVHGLVALMEIQHRARARARAHRGNQYCFSIKTVRFGIRCSSVADLRPSKRAEELGGTLGPYALQAAITACHARARTPKKPIGRVSRRSMMRLPRLHHLLCGTESRRRTLDGVRTIDWPRASRYNRIGAVP